MKEKSLDLILAEGEREDAVRAAARLANALTDINNEIGEIAEVKRHFSSVANDVASYKGLEKY